MQHGVNDWLGSFLPVASKEPILPNAENPSIGMGRLLTLVRPLSVQQIIDGVKKHIRIPHLRLGLGKSKTLGNYLFLYNYKITFFTFRVPNSYSCIMCWFWDIRTSWS